MLPFKQRLIRNADWLKVHKAGRATYSPELVLKSMKNRGSNSRFGFSISLKISKKATVRNKLKRQLRAVISNYQDQIKQGHDIIFIVKPGIIGKKYSQIEESVLFILKKAKLVK